MVRIVLREEYRKKLNIKQPMNPKVRTSLNVINGVLTTIEMMSAGKPMKIAKLLKELLDIFVKR